MSGNSPARKPSRYIDYVWLVIGSILFVVAGGKWNIPVATWLSPVFLMRFVRRQDKWYKAWVALPVLAVGTALFMYKIVPFPPEVPLGFYLFVIIGYTLLAIVPYLIDRALCRAIHHPLTVLVFPSVITTFHFLFAIFGPTGTAVIAGQNLFESTSLIQVVSVTGVWGLSFLIGWFASTVNALWENSFNITLSKRPAAAFTAVLSLVLIFGGFREAILKPTAETVKVGSLVVAWPEEGNVFWNYVARGTPREEAPRWRPLLQQLQDELFQQSQALIPTGVKVLMWAVGDVTVFQDDEPAFVQRAQAFAKENGIYFFPSILTMKYGQTECENKVLAITPEGQIAYTYYKARPSPGENLPLTDGKLLTVDTPYGRIGTAICYDMYFSDFIRQAGQQQVDILLVPADEPTPELVPYDTQAAMFRGVENGCSVLRSTLEGLTMGVDYQGHVLSSMNYYTTQENRSTITHIPTQGVRTLYAVAGDWFAYLAMLATAGAIVWAVYAVIRRGGHPEG